MLGVMESGAAFLLLDGDLPPGRCERMIRDAGCPGLIAVGSGDSLSARVGRGSGWILDVPSRGLAQADPLETSLIRLGAEDHPGNSPAYVVFTSGTTSMPRGVIGSHEGLAHFVCWQRDTFEIRPGDRFAQFTPLSFDVALRDIFTPLVSGATVCVPGPNQGVAGELVFKWLNEERISHMHLVPSLAQFMIENTGDDPCLPHARMLFFAGEPLYDVTVEKWRQACPNLQEVINLYGPTETTLAKCFFRVPSPPVRGIQPLGRPLPGAQAFILRDRRQVCGVGETGEISIRTPYRTLRYIDGDAESDSTPSRFFRNSLRADEGDLLFATGDLGRYLPDGTLEFEGRADDEIKVRGVRVNLSEIVGEILSHEAVAECAVLPVQDSGQVRLIAFVVSRRSVSHAELTQYLGQRLLSTMMPTEYLMIDRLPLTLNGKIDRDALARLRADSPQTTTGRESEPPETDTESTVAAIWAELLGVPQVETHENFFVLGGHSLLATRIISRIRASFGIEVPLRALFERPTVAELAREVERTLAGEGRTPEPEISHSPVPSHDH